MREKFFILVILLGVISPGLLQGDRFPGSNVSGYTHREISVEKLERYRSDSEFTYENNPGYLAKTFEDFMEWLGEKIKDAAKNLEVGDPDLLFEILKYFLITCFFLFMMFLVFKIIGTNILFKSKKVSYSIVDYGEDINSIDFDSLISKHYKNGDYRLVVRLLYLKTLRILSDNKVIEWKKDKTNRDYIYECSSTGLAEPFREVTRLFEYFWYGGGYINEGNISQVMKQFDELFRKIGAGS